MVLATLPNSSTLCVGSALISFFLIAPSIILEAALSRASIFEYKILDEMKLANTETINTTINNKLIANSNEDSALSRDDKGTATLITFGSSVFSSNTAKYKRFESRVFEYLDDQPRLFFNASITSDLFR